MERRFSSCASCGADRGNDWLLCRFRFAGAFAQGASAGVRLRWMLFPISRPEPRPFACRTHRASFPRLSAEPRPGGKSRARRSQFAADERGPLEDCGGFDFNLTVRADDFSGRRMGRGDAILVLYGTRGRAT